jgi:hypothetical protein
MSNREMSPAEVCLRRWGEAHLTEQQNRVWRHLIANEECEIARLFVAARPYATPSKVTPRAQAQAVGMVTSKINKRLQLKGQAKHVIRPGDSRFSYRLEPSAR